jgi:membrane protein DedA with SNARE-associated domain
MPERYISRFMQALRGLVGLFRAGVLERVGGLRLRGGFRRKPSRQPHPLRLRPYIPPIILAVMAGRLDPFPTALASALGAALAKAVLFKFFKGGRVLLGEDSRKRIEPLERIVARHGWLAVVAAAATPLPDDIIFLLLAVSNYSSKLFIPTVFAGKLLITTAVAYLSLYWYGLACYIIECVVGEVNITHTIAVAAATAAAALAAAYTLTRLDWTKLLNRIGVKT